MGASTKHLASFVAGCVALGMTQGLIAGILLVIVSWLISLFAGFNIPKTDALWESLFIFWAFIVSVPAGAITGMCLGCLLGFFSFVILDKSAKPDRKANFGFWIFFVALAGGMGAALAVNFILGTMAAEGGPNTINQFSAPAALITFVFVYTNKARVEDWYLESKIVPVNELL